MKKHISSLNGLRAISVLMVVGYHLFQHHHLPDNFAVKYSRFILLNGPMGVNIFFLISGFLITTLLIKERETTGTISLSGFFLRRTIRIFPAYYFLLMVYGLLQFFNYFQIHPKEWLSLITYTKQFVPGGTDEAAHLWSLSVEEMFYLLWPFIFLLFRKKTAPVLVVLISIILLMRIIMFSYPVPAATNTILATGDALLFGCLLALKQEPIVKWLKKTKHLGMPLFFSLLTSILIYNYFFSKGATEDNGFFYWGQRLSYAFFGNIGLVTNALLGVLILFSIHSKNLWYSFLNTPIMEYVGKLSYSIYLWQQLFTADKAIWHNTPVVILCLYIAIVALLSYHFIEKPFMSLRRWLATPKKRGQEDPAPTTKKIHQPATSM